MFGLPEVVTACLFDLDGVITRTASVHAAAWKRMFDDYLRQRDGDGFAPFVPGDYARYVDGKPRADGTRDFLASRGIHVSDAEITRLGVIKNDLVVREIKAGHVEVFDTSVSYLRAVRTARMSTAIVSSSANCRDILQAVGIADLFDARVDGLVAEEERIPGKPAPDMFLRAARELGVSPSAAAVFEDALAGVQAGRAGGFGYVVGVNRANQAEALRAHGADVVVDDLGELLAAKGKQ